MKNKTNESKRSNTGDVNGFGWQYSYNKKKQVSQRNLYSVYIGMNTEQRIRANEKI